MTRQEEIREWIKLALCPGLLLDTELWIDDGYYFLTNSAKDKITNAIVNNLHSQGVVIKVECKHDWEMEPIVLGTNPPIYTYICKFCQEIKQNDLTKNWVTVKAGFVAVDPLIKESK